MRLPCLTTFSTRSRRCDSYPAKAESIDGWSRRQRASVTASSIAIAVVDRFMTEAAALQQKATAALAGDATATPGRGVDERRHRR
ncbi:hypothetical protein GCM10023403_41570 [Pseudonocardia benzenivorans]